MNQPLMSSEKKKIRNKFLDFLIEDPTFMFLVNNEVERNSEKKPLLFYKGAVSITPYFFSSDSCSAMSSKELIVLLLMHAYASGPGHSKTQNPVFLGNEESLSLRSGVPLDDMKKVFISLESQGFIAKIDTPENECAYKINI